MNETNFFVINDKNTIVDQGLDLVFVLHHFLQGRQYNHLEIEPASGTQKLNIESSGAPDVDEPPTTEMEVNRIKIITIGDYAYTLVCYRLDEGVENLDD